MKMKKKILRVFHAAAKEGEERIPAGEIFLYDMIHTFTEYEKRKNI